MLEPRHATALTAAALVSFFAAALEAGERAPIPLGPGVSVEPLSDPFDYFGNSWTVVGLKDHPAGTRISPRGELLLGGGVVLRPLVGKELLPLRPAVKAVLKDGWIPIVTRDFVVNGEVRTTMEVLACPVSEDTREYERPSGDEFLTMLRVTLENVAGHAVEAVFGLERQPDAALEVRDEGEGIRLIRAGDSILGATRARPGAVTAEGSRLIYRAALPGKGSRGAIELACPFGLHRSLPEDLGKGILRARFDVRAAATEAWWRGFLGRGAALSVPEDKVRETWLASLVYQFIGRDRGEIHAGEGFYDEMYLRDGAYQSLSLAQAGFVEEARESLDLLLRFRKPDGQLVSQEGQLDANGYGMWAPVELARITGDLGWLRKTYPAIRGAAEWAMRARRAEKDPASPVAGVLPAAPADGENLWAGKNHILGYDWWNLRGIGCVAEAARMLGEEADAAAFAKEFEDYRKAILAALDRTGLPHIPPSYEKVGTHWGNLEVVFPTPLLDPMDPRVTATLAHVEKDFGAPDGPKGLIEGTMQWTPGTGAIHPYMTQFITNTRIIRGEGDEAVDGFYSFLLHTTSTHGFPEGVYFRKREAWGDTVPHLWAAALSITTLRNMLVREEGKDLHLLSAVPAGWLEPGKRIGLAGAPTAFGKVTIEAAAERDRILVDIRREDGRPGPGSTILHLPPCLAIRSAETGGRPVEVTRGAAVLPGGTMGKVAILVDRKPAGRAHTFASKAEAYLAEAVELGRPLPGILPAMPAGIDEAACVRLDLSRAATTNPHDGPFRVTPAPAFSGLPAGDLEVGGIPFRTVDPARNGGKGIVVLDGAQACRGLPSEAVIPASGARGRYLAILGGVTGWAPGDPGTGKLGAVAELEVRYAGGGRSSIPFVTGRTADDWLGAPGAADAAAVLRMGHWHLNAIVAALDPAQAVEAIVFRDLGTPAAPVIAAITIVP